MSENIPRSLYHLFDKNLERALQIVDKGEVKCYVAEKSGRTVYQARLPCCTARCLCSAFNQAHCANKISDSAFGARAVLALGLARLANVVGRRAAACAC